MKKGLFLLVGGTATVWLLSLWPARLLWDEPGWLFATVAAGLCLVPMLGTFVWSLKAMSGDKPEAQLLATLGGTGLRMLAVIGGGMLLYYTVPALGQQAFWYCIIFFYLVTLTLEMILLVQQLNEQLAKKN